MNKGKIVFSSGLANTFEWYDYALFGHFAPILGAKFFPDHDPSTSLLYAFLAFAIGYLMRPLGGVFFGILGDRFGRRAALSGAIICMAVPTMTIGLLPTYESIGITATALMIIARMLQGLSMGGALTGSISFVIEHAPKEHRGLAGSISMSSICIGILLGSVVAYSVKNILSPEHFLDWGWRIPFLIGIFIIFAGLYIRNNTSETPLFEEMKNKGKLARSPLKDVLKNHWFDMLITICINSTGSVIFYTQAIYLMNFLKQTRGFEEHIIDNIANICYLIMAVATVLVAGLSDIIGRRKIYFFNLVIIAISCPFIMATFETGSLNEIIIMQILLSVMAAAYIGPEPALQAAFYPTKVRNTALSISYNLATSIFGGTTPFILEYLYQTTNTVASWAYYIVACCVISFISLFFYKDRMDIVAKEKK